MKSKPIQSIDELKSVYRITYTDGSTGILEMDPIQMRPIIDGKICDRCRCGIGHCLYIKLKDPDDNCPVITISEY